MWGCIRWPECSGAINIDPPTTDGIAEDAELPIRSGVPGRYAQDRFERARARDRLKTRAVLPLATGLALVMMATLYLAAAPFGLLAQSIAAVLAGGAFMLAMVRMPVESMVWAKGLEGERKTATFIEPLLDAGYVVLFNRMIPGINADIDSLVIGPTGVFPIETKNWNGKIEVKGDRLFVGDRDRSWVIQQVYREALAVQVALGEELTAQRLTVTPILCAIGGVSFGGKMAAGVHVTDGKRLLGLIADRPSVLDDEAIQRLARLADRRLRLPYAWETAAT